MLGCLRRYALPGPPLGDNAMAFFDEPAALTRQPDASFEKSQGFYEGDDRAGVPRFWRYCLLRSSRPDSARGGGQPSTCRPRTESRVDSPSDYRASAALRK